MVGVSEVPYSQRVYVHASEIGRATAGDFGVRMRNLDAKLRECGGVANGLNAQTRGCWGLNVANLPEHSSLLVRLGPFPPKDGTYLLRLRTWRLVDIHAATA